MTASSLMHAGRVLAVGAPLRVVKERGGDSLEEHLRWLSRRGGRDRPQQEGRGCAGRGRRGRGGTAKAAQALRTGATMGARRETVELLRDPDPALRGRRPDHPDAGDMGFGISFDIENLAMAVRSGRHTAENRELLQGFEGSRRVISRCNRR